MSKPCAYPLAWPVTLERHGGERRKGATQTSLNRSMAELQDSLHLLEADTGIPVERVVVSSNVTLGDSKPRDPGVAVYFDWGGAMHCIAVDEFATVEGNLRAVYSFVERCRTDLRTGGLPIVRAVLSGFRLPEKAEAT